jgi:hypothetical protein
MGDGKEVKRLFLNVLETFIEGESNKFHAAMEEAEEKLTPYAFDYLKNLIETVPKEYTTTIELIFQLLVLVKTLKFVSSQAAKDVIKASAIDVEMPGTWLR